MRTLTAVALAITMLAGVTAAQAATHKKHHGKKHQASSESKGDKGSKEKAPATK